MYYKLEVSIAQYLQCSHEDIRISFKFIKNLIKSYTYRFVKELKYNVNNNPFRSKENDKLFRNQPVIKNTCVHNTNQSKCCGNH